MIAKIGAVTISLLQELGSINWMLGKTISEIMERVAKNREPFPWGDLVYQSHRVGVGSVPMVVLLSFFVGLTMALLTGYQLQVFGLATLVPSIVAVSFVREMGPLFTGIILASRIGAAYTAELGAMTAGGEVDAIEAMGIGALRYLVTPRILAIFLLTPCLTVVASVLGICGAALISDLLLDMTPAFFFDQVFRQVLAKDMISGMSKCILFGAIIGIIACYKGLSVKGGAMGVGVATTSSVVSAISTVIGCDAICNVILVTFSP